MINLQTTMKHILLLTFAILFSSVSYTQNAYYEALYLAELQKEFLDSLSKYSELTQEEKENIKNYKRFINNPLHDSIGFLDFTMLKKAIVKYNTSKLSSANQSSNNPKKEGLEKGNFSLPEIYEGFSFNGNWQTVVFDELTKYYAEEFRKAQMVTYMQGFKQVTEKIGDFEVLFPQTYLKLKTADVASFPDLGAEYKRIFAEDLKNIPASLIRHINTYDGVTGTAEDKRFKVLNADFVKNTRANSNYQYFVVTADIATRLTNGMHPSNLFQYLDANYYFSDRQDILGVSIHGLNLLQKNLVDTTATDYNSPTKVWIKIDDLGKLEKKKGWEYFIGLIYQQDKPFFSKELLRRSDGLSRSLSKTELNHFRKIMINTLTGLREIETVHKSFENDSLQKQFGNYMSVVVKAINIINYSFDKQASPALAQLSTITDLTINIFENARKKDFSTTVFYSLAAIRQLGVIDSIGEETLKTIERYGSFITDVVSADSTQIKGLIKKHAAPPTSFILKREYTFNISLTGQPGYFFAIERLNGPNHKPAFVSGLSLPLGFDFSFKYQSKRKPIDLGQNRGSFNLFMQFLDLGAILNFRLSDETSLLPDQVNFDQLFSPGFAFSWGFKNSPLTIGAGYQYSPKLREVTNEEGNGLFPNGHRIFARVSWDIPLLNIYHSKQKFWTKKKSQ